MSGTAHFQASTVRPRHRLARGLALAAAGLAVAGAAGCSSSSSAPTAAASPTPAAADVTSPPVSAAATSSAEAGALSLCSDAGLHSAFQAWKTLMKSDTTFSQWEQTTATFQSEASSAQSTDAGFGDTAGATAAGALATALATVQSDLTQGETSGTAPASYAADVQAAEAFFQGCP